MPQNSASWSQGKVGRRDIKHSLPSHPSWMTSFSRYTWYAEATPTSVCRFAGDTVVYGVAGDEYFGTLGESRGWFLSLGWILMMNHAGDYSVMLMSDTDWISSLPLRDSLVWIFIAVWFVEMNILALLVTQGDEYFGTSDESCGYSLVCCWWFTKESVDCTGISRERIFGFDGSLIVCLSPGMWLTVSVAVKLSRCCIL